MFELIIEASCGEARAGRFRTPHGTVTTPTFMPVGTRGAFKATTIVEASLVACLDTIFAARPRLLDHGSTMNLLTEPRSRAPARRASPSLGTRSATRKLAQGVQGYGFPVPSCLRTPLPVPLHGPVRFTGRGMGSATPLRRIAVRLTRDHETAPSRCRSPDRAPGDGPSKMTGTSLRDQVPSVVRFGVPAHARFLLTTLPRVP